MYWKAKQDLPPFYSILIELLAVDVEKSVEFVLFYLLR